MILSFALTTRQFLAGIKTETRRDWKDRTLAIWQKSYDEGRLVHDAVDKGLHRGGKRIGKFKLTARPIREPLSSMTEENLKREGLLEAVKTAEGFCRFVNQPITKQMTVIRFEKL